MSQKFLIHSYLAKEVKKYEFIMSLFSVKSMSFGKIVNFIII